MIKTGSFIWLDANGYKTILRVNSGADPDTLAILTQGCSNAAIQSWWEGDLNIATGISPLAAVFQSVTDRAVLIFVCADTTNANIIIPAPSSGIFMADGETVDTANPNISLLILTAIGTLCNENGALAVAYASGYRLPNSKAPL